MGRNVEGGFVMGRNVVERIVMGRSVEGGFVMGRTVVERIVMCIVAWCRCISCSSNIYLFLETCYLAYSRKKKHFTKINAQVILIGSILIFHSCFFLLLDIYICRTILN